MADVTFTLLTVILSSILLIILRWVIKRYYNNQILKRYGIPGPKPNFFDGHLFQLEKDDNPFGVMDAWFRTYGNVFGYYTGEIPYIVVNDREIIKKVLIKDFSVFNNRPKMFTNVQPFGDSLIGLSNIRWKEVRSILSPVFSPIKLKLMMNIFEIKVDTAIDVVYKKAQSKEMFDIYGIFKSLTLDVICACALAMKTNCLENENDPTMVSLQTSVSDAQNLAITLGIMFPILETVFTFMVNNFNQHSRMKSFILRNLDKVISERRENPDLRSMDIIQLMIEASQEDTKSRAKLSTAEIIANAYLVLLAGYRTTSTALAYTLYLLVKHPDIQERLFQEIDKAPDTDYTTLQELRYLGQVFDESLRMYPPSTGFISRECKEDYDAGAYTFPKDSVVLVPLWQLQHDPKLFPDPWKFDPDRFSQENKHQIKSMSYLPFGEGPRSCIGSRFAQLEAKLALFKLIKKFKFVPCEKTEENISLKTFSIATKPKNGVWLRALPRETNN